MSEKLPELVQGSGDGHNGPHLHKTLFEGSKNFWRTRENVDVRIIQHIDANAIEIVSFSVDKHEEADRVFLYADRVFKKLDNADLAEKISLKREELAKKRKRVPNEEIKEGLLQELSVQYVLARINPSTTTVPKKEKNALAQYNTSSSSTSDSATKTIPEETEEDNRSEGNTSNEAETVSIQEGDGEGRKTTAEGGAPEEESNTEAEGAASAIEHMKAPEPAPAPTTCAPRFAIDFVALTGDKKDPKTGNIDVLMMDPPPDDAIEHIVVVRARKKATTKEFNQALRSLRQDSQKLNKAMSDAQRKAGLAVSSIEGFQNFGNWATYDPEKMSISRWRWIKSIRRVILQNAVAAYTKRIEFYYGAQNKKDADEDGELGNNKGLHRIGSERRVKASNSTTKLPLLKKKEDASQKRKSMGSLRRIARGSREPRPMDDFSAAFSGGIKGRVESHMNGQVLTTGDMMKKYGMKPNITSSESATTLPSMH